MLTLGASQFHGQLQDALRQEGLAPEFNYVFTNVNTVAAMVEAGLGVGILPAVAVPRGTALKALRIVRPALVRTIAIVTIRGHTLSPSAARFVDICDLLRPPKAGKTA